MSGYLRPVNPTNGRMSTYSAHTRRTTPSSEAGVDYYCPIGTPILAAGPGVIFEVGGSVHPATGRYVTLDLDDGRRVRYLHLKSWAVKRGDRVKRGTLLGLSGASGYGSEYFGATGPSAIPANTGGPHVHVTLWPGHYYRFGRYPLEPTLDFERYVGGSTAGGGSSPISGDDEMDSRQAMMLETLYQELLPGKAGVKTQGAVSKVFTDTLAAARAASAAATGAKDAIVGHVGEWVVGEAGVRNAGRLYGLLVRAATAPGADVDEKALAAALAPHLADVVSSLTDADVQKLAKAVADEQARRLAS